MNLSKSKYCNAVQCPKMLWLSKYKKEVYDDSVLNQAVLEQGSEVGDLAMGLFGDFTEVPFGDLSKMITETNYLIESGTEIITEASFAYKGLFCSVDILKNKGGGHVELYEVKSSSEVHGIYYDDVAYQCYVLKLLGYIVDRACVVHINTSYVRNESLDLEQLFIIADITAEAEEKFDEVDANIEIFGSYMEQKEEPIKDISMECFNPYECGYFKYCTRNLPTPNVFDVARLSKKKKFEYYNNGVISFKDLYEKKVLTKSYVKQVEHEVLDEEPYIDVDAIKEFMENLSYPIYFLDFETFSSPIPLYKNSSPYQQIPFQYSLHYIEYEDAVLQHKEFLAQAGTDPRRALAERLCSDIPKDVCVTAYNMGFEKGRIKELARMYTDLAEHLMNIHDNIVDLMIPFQKKQYYQKEMQGSYSIKYVLPALFPDDPELNYANLEGIHNGSEASNAFRKMVEMEPKEVVKYREHLLNYCKLDTYAMVKIWHKLNEVIGIEQRSRRFMKKEIKNGLLLKETELPVPSKKNERDIYCLEQTSRFTAYREGNGRQYGMIAYLGQGNLVKVDKPTFSEEDDRSITYEQYRFLDCFIPSFSFAYKNNGSRDEWIKYTQLSDVVAYIYLDTGLLFVKKEQLYFLSDIDRRFYHIGNVGKGVFKMLLNSNNDIEFHYIEQYKLISQNQRYVRAGEDYTGYSDIYEIRTSKKVLKKEKLGELLENRKEKTKANKEKLGAEAFKLNGTPFKDFGPFPTKRNYSNIEITAKSKFKSEWISKNQFEIKKSLFVAYDKEKDSFEYQVTPSYNFYYWNEHDVRIPYTYLQDIHAYYLYDKGILFIKDGNLYDLNSEEKKYNYITAVKGLIHKIDLEGKQVIIEKIKNYKKIIENEEIVDGEYCVIGHKDLYDVEIERMNIGYNVRVDEDLAVEGISAKYAYWKSFIEYASESGSGNAFLYSGFTLPNPADRNWYALRLGTAKARIELQINTRNNMIRTALFIKDENIWNKVETLLSSKTFDPNKLHIDTESKTPSISIYKPIEGMDINKKEQYDWFMEYALMFKHFYDVATE